MKVINRTCNDDDLFNFPSTELSKPKEKDPFSKCIVNGKIKRLPSSTSL